MFDVKKIIEDLGEDHLQDFVEAVHIEIMEAERCMMQLDSSKNSEDSVNHLFRALHNMKINCRLVFIDPLVSYVHVCENLVSEIRSGGIKYTPQVGEVLLHAFDQLRAATYDILIEHGYDQALLEQTKKQLHRLMDVSENQLEYTVKEILNEIFSVDDVNKTVDVETLREKDIVTEEHDDLDYFLTLSQSFDDRCDLWEGRTKIKYNLAMLINSELDKMEDEVQLAAAVYMHDFGMALLPERLLITSNKYTPLELMIVQEHAATAYEFMKRLEGWLPAANMIEQHHERVDGNGYPSRLSRDDICQGAKIIAVVDTFYALTHERPDRDYTKSVQRAVSEINSCAGTQFDSETVGAFNMAIATMSV